MNVLSSRALTPMKPGVFITFDVECSMGGAWGDDHLRPVPPSRAVWGRYGDRSMGLPQIVEMLERHGLAATFFVEAFMAEQGYPGEAERICEYLLDRHQDVQLHIHPNHKHYGLRQQGKPYPFTDTIADLDPPAQRAILEEGVARFRAWTGHPPEAFRAGNMGASEETLRQLAACDVLIDSSYAFPFLGGQCRFANGDPYNGSRWYGEVLELSLSGFRQVKLPGLHPAKPLDLVGISFPECRDAIRRIHASGADAVMILHSFSLFKVRDHQYRGGRPNRIVLNRFHRFCRWLTETSAPETHTFTDVARAVAEEAYAARHVAPCTFKHPRALLRKGLQAWNRFYWT